MQCTGKKQTHHVFFATLLIVFRYINTYPIHRKEPLYGL